MVNINIGFNRAHSIAVIDVAPGGATVAICSSTKDSAATVLSIASSSLSLESRTEQQAKSQIGEQVKEAAAQAIKLYMSAGHSAPVSEAYIVVHAPWAHTALISSEEHFESETLVQGALISAHAKKALSDGALQDAGEVLEASVIRVDLNGYATPAPEGKRAHWIRITSIVSSCDPAVKATTKAAVEQNFPVARITWRSGIRALMTLARESHLDTSFLVIDMGVEDTHIVSFRDGEMNQLIVPEGTRTILSRIAAGRPADEVVGYLRMLSRDACSTDACDALRQAVATTEPELVRVFGEAIGKIASKNRVPNGVLLLTHPDLESWFAGFLARIDFAQFTETSLPLSVHTAQSLDISNWVAGAKTSDASTVAIALVNIESRV
ncbi:MAG: hypothetical protein Athens041674_34 [Parcubacteria group bacterium Athens0416_74]|nr:MAG: hypothetical protein Athens041674_34 [Parcubacteria group bacterium Athens0416_74]